MTSVSEAYLALAVMTLVGIGFPVGSFIASRLLRPVVDPNNPTKTRSWLLPGYEVKINRYMFVVRVPTNVEQLQSAKHI